jgi:hypothetical protein
MHGEKDYTWIADAGENLDRFPSGIIESRWIITSDGNGKVVQVAEEITCSLGARWSAERGLIKAMLPGQLTQAVYKDPRTPLRMRTYMNGEAPTDIVRIVWYGIEKNNALEVVKAADIRPIHAIPFDRRHSVRDLFAGIFS